MSQTPSAAWRFWIDRGGTFTDIVAQGPDAQLHLKKLLSEDADRYVDAAIHGIRSLLGIPHGPIPDGLIAEIKMGTTVATNALLERSGADTVLAITRGFGDALRIGYQNRPQLFALKITLPTMLYRRVVEIDERVTAAGNVLETPNHDSVRDTLLPAFAAGFRSIAVVFMHGYRYPAHELQVGAWAREIGFSQISLSHATAPLMKLISRGDTTVADAYLSPILQRYVRQMTREFGPQVPVSFMQSNGGLVAAAEFQGKDSVLSGPAGGIVGMAQTSRAAGFDTVIGFDMGGTSTDVSHFAGSYERRLETTVAGVRLRAPMMNIHTVAAGGGSICRFDGARLRVGPESAGANPGPACYRRGGPLTITDCNVLIGKVQAAMFPAVFGAQGDLPLDTTVVREQFDALAATVNRATGQHLGALELATGFLAIAVDNMANAVKQVSVGRGFEISRYTLNCFGGAGGQHACLVAEALGMHRVMIHPLAGVLSAYGMGLADTRLLQHVTLEVALEESVKPRLEATIAELEATGTAALARQGIPAEQQRSEVRVLLKYLGSDTAIEIDYGGCSEMQSRFAAAYQRRFAFAMPDARLFVESLLVETIGASAADNAPMAPLSVTPAVPLRCVEMFIAGATRSAPVYDRVALPAGQVLTGPALIVDAVSTTVIEIGWTAEHTQQGNLILNRGHRLFPAAGAPATLTADPANPPAPDPVRLEIFNNLFMSVAEQMGAALQNTAHSVNIKERLDFSCALFDAAGRLIANAPHMPVHLGSMGDSVRSALAVGPKPGDVIALNNPYNGGTHLPDVTVVMPIFDEHGELLYSVAARGHHADVGGVTPGSMPAASTSLVEEGALIDNFLLVEAGRFREPEFRALLAAGPYPARNPQQNIADIRAQVAACAQGVAELERLMQSLGRNVVLAYMQHVRRYAAQAVRGMLQTLPDGHCRYALDDGSAIEVTVTVDREHGRARIDFTGSSPQHPRNFNAPASICRAAALYVMRTLLNDDIPLNDGCLEPVDLVIPDGSMLKPSYPAAVVAGNVETSQVVTDALFGATGRLAAAQGTMNNLTFGNAEHQYYETICGGAGAGEGFDGASAVHTHMTNSRLTDPEILEWRFPVMVEDFHIRRGSGGEGRWRGGDGVVRRLRFNERMTVSLLANRRIVPPFGLNGGGSGALGRGRVERRNGDFTEFGGTAELQVEPGDVIVIETPGGGGFGRLDVA